MAHKGLDLSQGGSLSCWSLKDSAVFLKTWIHLKLSKGCLQRWLLPTSHKNHYGHHSFSGAQAGEVSDSPSSPLILPFSFLRKLRDERNLEISQ